MKLYRKKLDHYASIVFSPSSDEEIETEHKLNEIMASKELRYGKQSHVQVLCDYKTVIF